MARQVIRKAQQRYKMVPVIDPATGKQKETPVMKADGTPKLARGGRPVTRKITEADKSQPIDLKCERCNRVIVPGEMYRKVAIKQTYGGIKRYRCIDCPAWQPWELSNSLASRIAQIQQETIDLSGLEDSDGISDAVSPIVEMIRELAEEKEQAASNIEDGFGHTTEMSEMLTEQANGLNEWADELENFSPPDDPPEGKCENCNGEGSLECSTHEPGVLCDEDCDGSEECLECGGTGEGEERDEQEMQDWRDSVQEELQSILDNCPVDA